MAYDVCMKLSKEDIRREALKRRRQMTPDIVSSQSQLIANKFFDLLSIYNIDTLHTYIPIHNQREVDTKPIVEQLIKRGNIRVATWTDFKNNNDSKWLNVTEDNEPIKSDQQYDVAVVPVVAFNKSGHRIGFGKGVYDKFLAKQPNSIKIGLAYDISRFDFNPEEHDIELDIIITGSQIITT